MSPTEAEADDRRPSELVIAELADHAGVDPLEFDVPLGDVIDPDALDALFSSEFGSGPRGGRVEFTYQEYHVTIVSDADGVAVDVTSADGAEVGSSVDRQEA